MSAALAEEKAELAHRRVELAPGNPPIENLNRDRLYARLAPDGLEVWYPPQIYLSPGEASCVAAEATSRTTQAATPLRLVCGTEAV